MSLTGSLKSVIAPIFQKVLVQTFDSYICHIKTKRLYIPASGLANPKARPAFIKQYFLLLNLLIPIMYFV